jgi:hypothetical protein
MLTMRERARRQALPIAIAIAIASVSACDSKSPGAPTTVIQPPVPVAPLSLSGTVSAFSGTSTSFQFTMNGQLVRGDGSTTFAAGSKFSELGNGLSVQVIGNQATGYLLASSITITSQSIAFTGRIISQMGSPPQLVLIVTSHTVMVSAATVVTRKGLSQSAQAIANGQTVDVRGRVLGDGTVVAGSVDILADAAGGTFLIEATISAMSGMCPQLQLTIEGYQINTNSATTFVTACGALNAGDRVEVQGFVQQDLTVTASSVTKK